MIGGQQGNSLLELIKQGKLQKKAPPAKKEDKAAASSRPVSAAPTTEVAAFTSYITHSGVVVHVPPCTLPNHRAPQRCAASIMVQLHHACRFCPLLAIIL